MSKHRILIVDDDLNLLRSFERVLSRRFDVTTAESGERGLEVIGDEQPFSVIISDFKMPGMNGVEFLTQVKQKCPDTVRIILTGYAELATTIDAVNEGNVFRFLTKPCSGEVLAKALLDAIGQFELLQAQTELQEKTLLGTAEVFSEMLAITNPEAYDIGSRIRRYVRYIAQQMTSESVWEYEMAALLCQMGCVLLSEDDLLAIRRGRKVSPEIQRLYEHHPATAHSMLVRIPRLERIAQMILYQSKRFDGSGFPHDSVRAFDIPLGGRILKLALDYDAYLVGDEIPKHAFAKLEENPAWYDPEVLYYLDCMLGVESQFEVRHLRVEELTAGMIVHQTVYSVQGSVVLKKHFELTEFVVENLVQYNRNTAIHEPITVLVP